MGLLSWLRSRLGPGRPASDAYLDALAEPHPGPRARGAAATRGDLIALDPATGQPIVRDIIAYQSFALYDDGDAIDGSLIRGWDGSGSWDDPNSYLRRGQGIGGWHFFAKRKGRTGRFGAIRNENGADGRAAGFGAEAAEDFTYEGGGANLYFYTVRNGLRHGRPVKRLELTNWGGLRLARAMEEEGSAATPYLTLWWDGSGLYAYDEKNGRGYRLAMDSSSVRPPAPDTGGGGGGPTVAWYAGSGFTDGWYDTATGKYLGNDKSRPPSGYTVVSVPTGTKPPGY